MQKITVSVLLILFLAACIHAQRGGRGKGRGPRGRGGMRPGQMFPALKDADIYNWDVDTPDGTLIPQRAFVLPDKDVVGIITISKDLRGLNITPSVVVMNPATGMMIIKQAGRNTPCFLTTFSASKIELESDFAVWNDTTIAMPGRMDLNGTGPAMSRDEAVVQIKSNPAMRRICRNGVIIPATAMTAGTEDPDTKTLQLMGYDSLISLMVPESRARGPGGPRGGRPGGIGGGRPGGIGGGRPGGIGGGRPGGRFPGGLGSGRFPGRGGRDPGRNNGGGQDQDQGQDQGQGQDATGRGRGDNEAGPFQFRN